MSAVRSRVGWFDVYISDARCIGCHREFSGQFSLRLSQLDRTIFDDVKCPPCGTRNYAKIEADAT
jgi:DNA-directed RNA polymerase subunit RPC12/RpoP